VSGALGPGYRYWSSATERRQLTSSGSFNAGGRVRALRKLARLPDGIPRSGCHCACMETTTHTHKRMFVAPMRLALVVGLTAAGVLMAACGGSSGASSSTSGGSSTGKGSTTAFQSCLAKHGVTLPKGANGGGPPSGGFSGTPPSGGAPASGAGGAPPSGAGGFGGNSKFQKAIQACASLQPKGAGGANGANSSAFASYRNCMKLHGVSVGSFSPGASSTTQTTVDTTSPAYQAASAACKSLLPSGGAPPTSSAAG